MIPEAQVAAIAVIAALSATAVCGAIAVTLMWLFWKREGMPSRRAWARMICLWIVLLAAAAVTLSACADKRGNATVQPCGAGALFCVYG